MATFIATVMFTAKGVQNVRESPNGCNCGDMAPVVGVNLPLITIDIPQSGGRVVKKLGRTEVLWQFGS